jgi:hypothetical protein
LHAHEPEGREQWLDLGVILVQNAGWRKPQYNIHGADERVSKDIANAKAEKNCRSDETHSSDSRSCEYREVEFDWEISDVTVDVRLL